MMNMAQKIRIHKAIEAEDRAKRTWYLNNLMLEKLTESFPVGSLVENFGTVAEVVGYQAAGQKYTGDLILREPETELRWIGSPQYCSAIA